MADLVIADVSEFQGAVNWDAYAAGGYPAAVARLTYGTTHVDTCADTNVNGMRARLRCRGFYGYMVASQDPAAQAETFARVLQAHGGLKPGEWVACDCEEGTGNQEPRAAAWLAAVNAALHASQSQDVEYSGLNFVATHGGWVPGVTRWVAAYQPTEPQAGQRLWQCSDARSFPGIARPCDASIFHGTVDQLLVVINPAPAVPAPPPGQPAAPQQVGNKMIHTVTVTLDANGNGWDSQYTTRAIPWSTYQSVSKQGSYPPVDGYWPGTPGAQDRDGYVLVSYTGGVPGGKATVFVETSA